jgi:hypothetical protein
MPNLSAKFEASINTFDLVYSVFRVIPNARSLRRERRIAGDGTALTAPEFGECRGVCSANSMCAKHRRISIQDFYEIMVNKFGYS